MFEEVNERGFRIITFEELLLGIKTMFPLGTRTEPRRPVVTKVAGFVVYNPVTGLKNPTTGPELGVVVGTKNIRPSGKSRLPQKELVPGVEPTLPNTGR